MSFAPLVALPVADWPAGRGAAVLPDAGAVGHGAARLVQWQLLQKPDASLLFPTGKTPLPMYAALRALPQSLWLESRLFQLDEYVPPAATTGPLPYETFATFMDRELWGRIDANKAYFRDYLERPEAYDALASAGNGPDVVILGIGGNGHIAFNEPGSAPDSPTRRIALAPQTRRANFGQGDWSLYPAEAVTIGLKTILQARRIVLLATGEGKRAIVQRAFGTDAPPDPDCPASWLKRHPCVTVLTDFAWMP